MNAVVNLGFPSPSYTFMEGERAEVEVNISSPFAFDIPFKLYAERLFNETLSFKASLLKRNTGIIFSFNITDDNIALEPDEHYSLELIPLKYNPQVVLTTSIVGLTIIDDDGEF